MVEFLVMFLALSYRFLYVLFYIYSNVGDTGSLIGSHISALMARIYPDSFIILMIVISFHLWGRFLLMHIAFWGLIVLLWTLTSWRMISQCTWNGFFLFNFKISWQHIYIICLRVLSWSLPSASYPKIRMIYAMPNMFCRPLNRSSIFVIPWPGICIVCDC